MSPAVPGGLGGGGAARAGLVDDDGVPGEALAAEGVGEALAGGLAGRVEGEGVQAASLVGDLGGAVGALGDVEAAHAGCASGRPGSGRRRLPELFAGVGADHVGVGGLLVRGVEHPAVRVGEHRSEPLDLHEVDGGCGWGVLIVGRLRGDGRRAVGVVRAAGGEGEPAGGQDGDDDEDWWQRPSTSTPTP